MGEPKVDTKKLAVKPTALEELLRTHYSVYVQLDSRKIGVIVPKYLRQAQLVLLIGLNMKPTPIPDLKIDAIGFQATLTFNRMPYKVFIPWGAVFAIVGDSGIGNLWQQDMPPDAPNQIQRHKTFTEDEVPVQRDPEKHAKLPPGWKVIDGQKK